jgi:hypothetical protein
MIILGNNLRIFLIVFSIFLLNACDKKKNQNEIIIEKLIEIPKTLDLKTFQKMGFLL